MEGVEISHEPCGVVRATLTRPEKRNALTHAAVDTLIRTFTSAAANPDLPIVVLDATGPIFCAGADKALLENLSLPDVQSNTRKFTQLLQRFESLPNITIALVQGHAVGLGMHLALGADFLLLKDDVKLWAPEFKLGLPDVGHHHLLSARLGRGRALGLSLLGEHLDAKAACTAGLAYASFPDDNAFSQAADDLMNRLVALSTELRRVTKAAYLTSNPLIASDLQVSSSISCLLENGRI